MKPPIRTECFEEFNDYQSSVWFAADMGGDCRHQKLIVLAWTAAAVGDLVELLLGLPDIVFQEIGLAEILARLGVIGIDRERLTVIVDALVDIAELARRVADQVQHLRRVAVLDAEEQRQRLGVARLEHELAGSKIEILIGQSRRPAVDAGVSAAAPHLPGGAARLDAAALLLAIPRALGAALGPARLLAAVVELAHLLDGEGGRQRQGKPKRESRSAKYQPFVGSIAPCPSMPRQAAASMTGGEQSRHFETANKGRSGRAFCR